VREAGVEGEPEQHDGEERGAGAGWDRRGQRCSSVCGQEQAKTNAEDAKFAEVRSGCIGEVDFR
jgi:hypothetical protein